MPLVRTKHFTLVIYSINQYKINRFITKNMCEYFLILNAFIMKKTPFLKKIQSKGNKRIKLNQVSSFIAIWFFYELHSF